MLRVAKRWVVTVEPEWESTSDFRIKEMIDEDSNNILFFYSNVYSEAEMVAFAQSADVTYTFTRGFDDSRSSFLKRYVNWQVTVYTKR